MDVLYDNLDNYTEESTIAELREENKELKSKLDKYAAALDKLQKEFDVLTSEHKRLELNYSSLLKTARSEIERKTQIITKLNVEKDAMVLNSIQNRNSPFNRRKDKQIKIEATSLAKPNINSTDNSKEPNILPSQVPNERRVDSMIPSQNSSSLTNMQTRLLDLVNKTISTPSIIGVKNIEVKENIQIKQDAVKTTARICNRRKSMPAFSMDCPKFSDDDEENDSNGSSKELVPKDHPERRNFDRFRHDKPIIQDKMVGQYDPSRDTQRSRHSRQFDSFKHRSQDKYEYFQRYKLNRSPYRDKKVSPDRRRVSPDRRRPSPDRRRVSPGRRKGSSDKRRGSPEKYRQGNRDHADEHYQRQEFDYRQGNRDHVDEHYQRQEFDYRQGNRDHVDEHYQRQEFDRRRRLVSPSKEKFHDYKHRSRESQRSNERNPQDYDQYKSRSQDKYVIKHKMSHDYEELSSKRIKLDPQHKQEERRQVILEPLEPDLHNMSCQSPEFPHEAQPFHQIREIKLNASASAELDDPRLTSKKYLLKDHDGRPEICTVESTNIDVKVIDTSIWNMPKMKMPEALLTKPASTATLSDLIHKPVSGNKPVETLQNPIKDCPHGVVYQPNNNVSNTLTQKPKYTDMPNALVQKPEASDVTRVLGEKSKCTDNKTDELMKNTVTNNMPRDLELKAMTTIMPNVHSKKQVTSTSCHDMPNSLNQNPVSTEDLVKEIYMDIDNPISNTSMESGEIDDFDYFETPTSSRLKINETVAQQKSEKLVDEPLKPETLSPKLSNFKIPKKNINDTQSAKNSKGKIDNTKQNFKVTGKINDTVKESSVTIIKHVESPKQSKRKVPQRRSSQYQYDIQKYITAKEIIEEDLELSDEASDNIDVQMKQTPIMTDKANLEKNVVSHETCKTRNPDQIGYNKTNCQKTEKTNIEEKNKEITLNDTKKSRTRKKSLKLKESIELSENQDTAVFIDKQGNKKENTNKAASEDQDISLSIDQLEKIKNKITKELSGNKDIGSSLDIQDTAVFIDKQDNKKEKTNKAPSEDQDISLSIDQLEKIKNKITKELSGNKDIGLSLDKSGTKNGKQSKLSSKTKDVESKKKECKLKASIDGKDAAVSTNKSVKKKETKTKKPIENKDTSDKPCKKKSKDTLENTEHSASDVNKQVKTHDNKTKDSKFNELFGDSSSLVSPEDLGLVPAVVPQENYETIFEDAQDAIDMNTIRDPITTTVNNYTFGKVDAPNSFRNNIENAKTPATIIHPIQTIQGPVESLRVESTPILNMYQNLQPEISPKEDSVKTIIISTGTQSQCALDKSGDLHVMQCIKPTVLQDVAMQALATSTPHKTWQQNVVQAETNPIVPNPVGESNKSRETVVSTVIDNSDSNTNTSPTNQADEPDMTIFVKRRRRVIKKK